MSQLDVNEVLKKDRAHVWHPLFQHQQLENQDLTVIQKAKGCTITDGEGNEFIDGYGGLWNVNIGYGREEVAEAVYTQMKQLS